MGFDPLRAKTSPAAVRLVAAVYLAGFGGLCFVVAAGIARDCRMLETVPVVVIIVGAGLGLAAMGALFLLAAV